VSATQNHIVQAFTEALSSYKSGKKVGGVLIKRRNIVEFEIFESESKGIRASGYIKKNNQFVVQKGSFAIDDIHLTASFKERDIYVRTRNKLIQEGKLVKQSFSYQFTEDVEFNSPSLASCIIWGSNLNGRKVFGIGIETNSIIKTHHFYYSIDSEKAIEGYKLDTTLNSNSRDKKIVEKRKELDSYTCQICDYKMSIDGKYIIECHHLNPIALGERETSLNDLASLCPTCHRIVHMRKPIYTLSEAKKLIKT